MTVSRAIAVEAIEPDSPDAGVPAHFGDPMREQRTLATGSGLVDRSNRGVIAVTGPDRLSWLHDITTQHLAGLPPLTGTETLVLSPHGHVEHHAVLLDDGETTLLDVEPGTAPGLLDFLQRMRFMLRVEPVDASADWALYTVAGPSDLAEPDVLPVPGPKFPAGTVPPRPTTRYSVSGLASGGYARRMPYGVDLLVPRGAPPGVPDVGLWAFEALRVGDRRPRLGPDTDHRTLPAELGWIAEAVHLEKGCYRGQETVARVHHLGRPPRRLALLHLDGIAADTPPAPHTPVTTEDGREVGFAGTAVRHYELGMIAIALLKRSVPDDAPLRVAGFAAAIEPDGGP